MWQSKAIFHVLKKVDVRFLVMDANVKIPDDAYSRNALWESLSSRQPRFQDLSCSAENPNCQIAAEDRAAGQFPTSFDFPVRLKTRENVDSTTGGG